MTESTDRREVLADLGREFGRMQFWAASPEDRTRSPDWDELLPAIVQLSLTREDFNIVDTWQYYVHHEYAMCAQKNQPINGKPEGPIHSYSECYGELLAEAHNNGRTARQDGGLEFEFSIMLASIPLKLSDEQKKMAWKSFSEGYEKTNPMITNR